jgi:hypothetical protein
MRLLTVAAATLALGYAMDGLAQFGGPMGGMGGGPPGGGPGGRSGPRGAVMASGSHLVASMEQQLDNLRFQLKLRPEQEIVWLDYQEKIGALVADQLRPAPPDAQATDNALRQIDRKIDVVRNRLTAMEDIADAARRLYDKLDETQRGVADRLLAITVPALYSGLATERPGEPGKGGDRPGKDSLGPPPD